LHAQKAKQHKASSSLDCFVEISELLEKVSVHSSPVEHYHKVKGLYTWGGGGEVVRVPVELEGSGRLRVICE